MLKKVYVLLSYLSKLPPDTFSSVKIDAKSNAKI